MGSKKVGFVLVKPPREHDKLFEAVDKLQKGECLKITLDDDVQSFLGGLSHYCIKHNKKVEFDLKPLGSNKEWVIKKLFITPTHSEKVREILKNQAGVNGKPRISVDQAFSQLNEINKIDETKVEKLISPIIKKVLRDMFVSEKVDKITIHNLPNKLDDICKDVSHIIAEKGEEIAG